MANAGKAAYEAITAELAAALVRPTKTFGMPTLTIGKRVFAGLNGEAMVFKLSAAAQERVLALAGARPFDPMGGRPMRNWIEVPPAHAELWPELAREALA